MSLENAWQKKEGDVFLIVDKGRKGLLLHRKEEKCRGLLNGICSKGKKKRIVHPEGEGKKKKRKRESREKT